MRNLRLFLVSLLIACLVWVMHTFSLDYSATVPCAVRVVTNLEGYAPEAEAHETLLLRGKASGFYLLKARGTGHRPMPVEISVDASRFQPVEGEEDTFSLPVTEVRDKLDETLGDRIDLDFIEAGSLTFTFTPQSFVKVPVAASLELSFRPQYMQVGQVRLKPDSVRIYGAVNELQRITEAHTAPIAFKSVDKNLRGEAALEPVAGLRFDAERVAYEVDVDRYVENTLMLPVKAVNVPAGQTMMILPSQVECTFLSSFRPRGGRITADDLSLEVDYGSFAGAGSTRMIPSLVTDREIYGWRLKPEMVECIQVEER